MIASDSPHRRTAQEADYLPGLLAQMGAATAAGADPWEILGAYLDAHPDPAADRAADRWMAHRWPLIYHKTYGIRPGMQYTVLGFLAARYARDFTADELAAELWEVIEASDQGRPRWTYRQICATAARAKRFIEREDAKDAALLRRAARWLGQEQGMSQREVAG